MDASLVRRERPIGRSETASREPAPALRGYVSRYWGYAEQYSVGVARRELPSPEVVVILSFGRELRLLHDGAPGPLIRQTSFVAGLTQRSVVTEMDGVSHGMQLNLSPFGARALLGTRMDALTNRAVSLDDLLGREAGLLLEHLFEAPTWPDRFDILDDALLARLERARPPAPSAMLAWNRLLTSGGRASVQSLTAELRCSRKHLAACFRDDVGLSPKAAARLLRFHHVVEFLAGDDAPDWARVAHACGYYDQSHFNRDFRQFAGSTPTEFVARRLPDELGLSPG